ncbi:MAG: oligosaccharide flippase family protein [Lachnospiraceae bacterium]|nr:oligosaccharide flippase family protein [Lachnospiraceae bacterium]
MVTVKNKLRNKWNLIPVTAKATVAYSFCGILQKCFGFIILPLFTRLLTPEQFGQRTLYFSWKNIMVIFITLNLQQGSFATAMMKYEDRRDEYISSIEGICIFLFVFFLGIYLAFENIWNEIIGLPTFINIVMFIEILTSTAIQFWSGKKRFEYKYKSVVLVTIINCFFSALIAYILVLIFEEKGYAQIIGSALLNIIIGGYIFIYNIFKCKKVFSKEMWKFALGFNIPLVVYFLSQFIFNHSDKIMIGRYCGADKAGIYGLANSIGMLMTFAINVINNTYVPWFYDKLKNNKQEENKPVSNMIALLLAMLLLIIIWFSPEIIYILGGKAYEEAKWIVPPIAVSVLLLFYSQLFINIEFYYEEKKNLVVASIGAGIVNIILNALFIPRLGYIVAGYTTMFSYLIFVISNYFSMKKVVKRRNVKENCYEYKVLIYIIIVFIILVFLGELLYRYLMIRIMVIAMILSIFIYALRRCISKYIRT